MDAWGALSLSNTNDSTAANRWVIRQGGLTGHMHRVDGRPWCLFGKSAKQDRLRWQFIRSSPHFNWWGIYAGIENYSHAGEGKIS
ncbi:hypothetical protein K443DRAFT_678239 [Laccaria amethystina LaAM-08-1]|uniref:Uncharacterized protein n=1 Tax=Laccaria amethystina LaAM-08-1 TaxID=1095629 RepID=A0A0C9XVN0_9AGAR|nr:hypothetical protein K443DRAFT_678239 [Laccaria amethystina LaAM-08-1]